MAYIALYRKYRSQSFDELMGQEHVTRTLQNAIESGRIAHAYLFYGARGCGKTSTARLLARALNCTHQDGPTAHPCGVCPLCVSIRSGTCMDVIEIDAASETGVDDVREKIIETVQYAPGEARYKVYIIDEVHDLSAKAFDALLKTIEEPPPHVVFVLATTEYHKVPITIRSRCQGYQFKRGTLHDLGAAVARVLIAEDYEAEPEAIQAIARAAEGSWRDALSILEQVLAYSDGVVTAATVHRAVGSVGTETLARVTQTLALGDWQQTLDIAADLVDSGADVRQLLAALQGHLRDLMLLASGAKAAAQQELGADRYAMLQGQTALFAPSTLLDMAGELARAEREIRFNNQHRWLLEGALLRCMLLAKGEPAGGQRPEARKATASVAESESASRNVRPTVPAPLSVQPAAVPKPPVTLAPPAPVYLAANEENEEAEEADTTPEEDVIGATVQAMPMQTAPALALSDDSADTAPRNGHSVPPAVAEAAAPEPEADNSHRFAEGVTLDVVRRAWPRILKLIEKASPSAVGFLKTAEVTSLDGNTIYLTFQEAFSRDRIQTKGRALVEKKINEALQTDHLKIHCLLQSESGGGSAVTAPKPTGPIVPPIEMAALLDTPASSAPKTNRSMMDFELPQTAPPPPPAAPQDRPEAAQTVVSASAPPDVAPPISDGLLREALDIFGGQVVSTQKLNGRGA